MNNLTQSIALFDYKTAATKTIVLKIP
jgi:hypothetical protein